MSEPMPIDDWIKTMYQPRTDEDKNFMAHWGWEQWLIKSQQHDLEQLRILLRADYMKYVLACVLPEDASEKTTSELLQGKSIIRTLRPISRFFQAVAKGWIGIRLTDGDEPLVMIGSTLGPLIEFLRIGVDIEDTGVTFTTPEAATGLQEGNHFVYASNMKGNFCTIPGVNDGKPIYVGHVTDSGCSPVVFWYDAQQWKKRDGTYRWPSAKYEKVYHHRAEDLGYQVERFTHSEEDFARLADANFVQ